MERRAIAESSGIEESGRFRILWHLALGLVVAAGAYWRIGMFWWDRALWLDPAMLTLNIVERGFQSLGEPLAWNQAAPIFFLWLTKATAAPWDYSERALCFWPLVTSLASLFLFARLSFKIGGPVVAFLATTALACSSTAIYYSAEVRPYSFDLLVAILSLSLGWTCSKLDSPRALWSWSALGILVPFFSHGGILVFAGTAVALLIQATYLKKLRAILPFFGATYIAQLAAYIFQIRPSLPPQLLELHEQNPGFPLEISSLGTWLSGYVEYPLGFVGAGALPWVLAILGLCRLGWRSELFRFIALPLLVVAGACALRLFPSAVGDYEINSRFLLVTTPYALLAFAFGAEAVCRGLRSRPAALIWIIFVLYSPVARSYQWPQFLEQDMRSLVNQLRFERVESDQIYVFSNAVPAFLFYTRGEPLPFIAGKVLRNPEAEIPQELVPLGVGRTFVVLSHCYADEIRLFQAELDRRGDYLGSWQFPGTTLFLYEIRRPTS
jgi:hypothetical protein